MLRGQRAQGAKKKGKGLLSIPSLPQLSTEHPDGCEPDRQEHQAEAKALRGSRCSAFTGSAVDYTGHGPNSAGYGEYLRLGGTFHTIYWSPRVFTQHLQPIEFNRQRALLPLSAL